MDNQIEITEYSKAIVNVGRKLLEVDDSVPPGYLSERMKSIIHKSAAEIILLAGFSIDNTDEKPGCSLYCEFCGDPATKVE